jgi:cell pole-organizing protein PopZ
MAARDQVMSSTERAPEPTMEEILASIRRIISEDESSAARQHTAPQNQSDEEVLETGEGEADDEIINDIARVLSGSGSAAQPAPEAPAVAEEQEDDILDLTAELGGLELVEDVEELELVEVAEEAPGEIFQAAPARPRPVLTPVEATPETGPDLELVEDASFEIFEDEASAPEPVAEPPAPMAQPAPAAAKPMSASEEAASALERAIAALRAGQVPTSSTPFSFQPSPEPVFQAQPEPVFPAQSPVFQPEPEPVFQPQSEPEALAEPAPSIAAPAFEPVPIPSLVSAPEPEAEIDGEPELVLTEVEVEMTEAEPVLVVETVVSEPQLDRGWGMSAAPDWSAGREGEAEDETETPHVNGGGGSYADSAAAKSLEDSVKDMLRPMLRQWLDENMARVLTAALKDELKNNPARLTGD